MQEIKINLKAETEEAMSRIKALRKEITALDHQVKWMDLRGKVYLGIFVMLGSFLGNIFAFAALNLTR